MNRYVIDEFYRDPALRRRLFAEAHRERRRALRAGLPWLGRRLIPRFDFGPSHWLQRLG